MICYLCGSNSHKTRQGKVRDNPSLPIYECNNCSLVFLPSDKHLPVDFYEQSGMHDKQVDIDKWLTETEDDDSRRYKVLHQLIENKSLLDVGCGNGGFLLKAAKKTSLTMGVELEINARDYHQKKNLHTVESINHLSTNDRFDFITLFHVLEHIADPINFLNQLKQHLTPGGKIIIEVPNSADALLTLYESQEFSNFTYWSCHLFLYNGQTLAKLFNNCGFKISYIKQIQRYPLANHLYWLSKKSPGGHKHFHFLNSPGLNQAYEEQLAALGICDTIFSSINL
ncbi:MAG: class I SAM-dependent methyltransferase [Oligoflexia bacterium]|nr:class I SAM-dependent methyltransferase [Oligoflexia bacterium]